MRVAVATPSFWKWDEDDHGYLSPPLSLSLSIFLSSLLLYLFLPKVGVAWAWGGQIDLSLLEVV